MTRAAGSSGWWARHPFVTIIVPAVAMLILGLLLGRFVVSPSQVAADAAPPAPTVLTAPVTTGRVQQSLVTDGAIEPQSSTTVAPAAPPDGARAVVSAVHAKAGQAVKVGTSLVDVAGRPTFVLAGTLAAYRALGPGMSGPDVTQLQTALRSLGYPIDTEEPSFSRQTKAAVEQLYADRGYQPIVVGQTELTAAKAAVVGAERAVAAAETALIRAKRDRPATGANANDGVNDAKLTLASAREDAANARSARVAASANAGPQIPLGEVVFLADLPATVASVSLRMGAEVGEGRVVLSSGPLVASSVLNEAQATRVAPKLQAQILFSDGTSVAASIATVAPRVVEGERKVVLSIVPATALKADQSGQTVRVTLIVEQAATDSLLVPQAAVWTAADGAMKVRVGDQDAVRDVPVATGASGDGLVAVTPLPGGQLRQGDLVVVGAA